MTCRNRPTNHLISNLDPYHSFPVLGINVRTYRTTLFSHPDNYNIHILEFGHSPDESHDTLYNNLQIGLFFPRTRGRLNTFPRRRRVRHWFGANHPQRYEVARQPDPPTVDYEYEIPIPTTVGHNYIYTFVRSLQMYNSHQWGFTNLIKLQNT